MLPVPTPAEMMRLWVRMGFLAVETQMVVGMRILGMAGLWRVFPSETSRMVTEKFAAASEAALATTRATLQGRSPALIAEHALKPVQRRTSANVKRLARRGPGKP